MCEHQTTRPGHRSTGDNIPGYAQGAYFPGDEPGEVCGISGQRVAPQGEECPHKGNPIRCALWKRSVWLCPDCLLTEDYEILLYTDGQEYACPCCEFWRSEAYLAAVYAENTRVLGELYSANDAMLDAHTKYEKVYNASERRREKAVARHE